MHLEIDTGMSRQGVRVIRSGLGQSSELLTLLDRLRARSCLHLEGVMTHFSMPEAIFSTPNAAGGKNPQLANLSAAVDLILDRGLEPQWLHAGNSSTMVFGPDQEEIIGLAARTRMLRSCAPAWLSMAISTASPATEDQDHPPLFVPKRRAVRAFNRC